MPIPFGFNHSPYQLPMEAEALWEAFRQGKGRVYLHARHGDSKVLQRLLAENLATDFNLRPRVEDVRGKWLVDLASLIGAPLADQAIAAAAHIDWNQEHYWDICQLFDILHELAQRGHTKARKTLYTAMRKVGDSQVAEVLYDLLLGIEDVCDTQIDRLWLLAYEFLPSGWQRAEIVARLIELERLPAWIAEEAPFDSEVDVRQIVASR